MKITKILDEKFSATLIIIGFLFIVIVTIFFMWKASFFRLSNRIDQEAFGNYGSIIGGLVGSIWGLAGVVLFYVALTEQRKDISINKDSVVKQIEALKMQKDENKKARELLLKQHQLIQDQNATFREQIFETSFYKLMEFYINLRQDLYTQNEENYFTKIKNEILEIYNSNENNDEVDKFNNAKESCRKALFNNNEKFSNYFKFLYRLFYIIDNSSIKEEKKKYFAHIIRSQLSEDEVFLLYYKGHIDELFTPIIMKYNLIKDLPDISKLEYKNFLIDNDISRKTNKFLIWFREFLNQSITNVFDIESDENINKSDDYKDLFSTFQILNDENLKTTLKVYIKKTKIDDLFLNINEIQNLVLLTLYNIFFLSNYIKIDREDVVKYNKASNDEFIILEYEICTNKELKIKIDD